MAMLHNPEPDPGVLTVLEKQLIAELQCFGQPTTQDTAQIFYRELYVKPNTPRRFADLVGRSAYHLTSV